MYSFKIKNSTKCNVESYIWILKEKKALVEKLTKTERSL